jgi:signal peptidase I
MHDPNPAPRRTWLTVGQFAATLGIVLLTRIVAAEAFYVPSGSMQPTLLIGDQLAVSKFPYGYSRYSLPIAVGPALPQRLLGRLPARGDVVVFRLPRDPSQAYVKRVVGLPGDRIQMRRGRLWINGEELPLRREIFEKHVKKA